MSAPRPDHSAIDDRKLRWVFVLVAALAGWMLTRSWHASILDRYEFRQLQTALSIFWIKQEGFRLDYLTPLFGPPWSIPMEFPTYQACVAALARVTGMELEQTGRLVSILFYIATLPAVYGLLELAGLDRSRRLLALAVILITPVYLFYPRTVMIETTALCFSTWFLLALHRTLSGRGAAWLAVTVACALLAALTKITTFTVFAAPGAILALAAIHRTATADGRFRPLAAWRPALAAALPVALALAATAWWVARGDALKHSNPYSGFLASTELQRWNYGDLALRFDPSFWLRLWQRVTENVLAEGALVVGVLVFGFATPAARRVALSALAGFFVGPLIFANLYHEHDYYYAANALLLSGAAGLLLASAWDDPRFTRGVRWTALTLVLLLQYRAFDRGYHYYYFKEAPPPPGLGALLRETVPDDGVILISGDDWNPLYAYYAQRRAVMVAGGRDDEPAVLEDVVTQLPPRRIAAMLLVGDKVRSNAALVRARAARFGLAERPFATGPNADLYLPADAVAPAALRLHGRAFGDARVLVSAAEPLPMEPVVEQALAATDYPMASPVPARARSQFGVSPGTENGRPVIYAHAPSELYFDPPAGTSRFSAVVGLPPSAYAKPLPEASDGVVVEIVEELPGGLRRSLLRRSLDPAAREADRGPQALRFDNGAPFTGRLIFTISPGPAGNLAYDQAWWTGIELQ